jgi:3-oxoacyl-[acyl-carrier-protein] synthase III
MKTPGTITAIGMTFPDEVRTNDWWEQRYPEVVANAREATLAKVWTDHSEAERSRYDQCIEPYLADPFRGTVERRWMSPTDTARAMELSAARAALAAGGYATEDIDLVLVHALRPDAHVVGEAAYLMLELGLRAPAIHFESACSSAMIGFHLASDLIGSGRYRRIMVVACTTYTRDVEPSDTFSWFLGDGAAAFVVEPAAKPGDGLLAAHTIPTLETCGIFRHDLELIDGQPRLMIRASRRAGKAIRDVSEVYLRTCVDKALSEAGVGLREIDFLVVNTPTAWYAEFCASVLGFAPEQTVDNYPRYANCGPVLWPNNLRTAVEDGRVRPGSLVLGYTIGSVSTAAAVVFRAGDIAVREVPIGGAG